MLEISIVIPTYNRLEQVKKLVTALEQQTYPKDCFEAVFVSDGSNDGTYEYLSHLSTRYALKPIFQENAGAAVARNTGARFAKGQIVLFMDDDILPAPDLVQVHAGSHACGAMTNMVVGPMLTPDNWQLLPWVAWEQAMLERQYRAMAQGLWQPTARQFYTGNVSLMREFFFANSGFDAQFRRAEDVEFAYRATKKGGRVIFNPAACAFHYAYRSFESWVQTAYMYGKNDVLFTQIKGIHWLLPVILSEFRGRNVLVRDLLNLYLDRQPQQQSLIRNLKSLADWSYHHKLRKVSQALFSGIFNLRYYQGIADQLGGRQVFFEMARRS